MSQESRSKPKHVANEIGPGLLLSCATGASLLLLAECSAFVAPFVHNLEIPLMEWTRLPYALFYSTCLGGGLSCISVNDGRRFAMVRKIIALVVAAYAFSALAGATLFAWIDFAAYDPEHILPEPMEHFFTVHSVYHPSKIDFLIALTPGALVAGIALAAASHSWNQHKLLDIKAMPFLLLVATAGCAAFLFGSARAEMLSHAISGEVDPADFGWPVLPVVALGSLGGWLTLKWWRGARAPSNHPSPRRDAAEIGDVLSSASRTSLVILVLLYLGISQISAYASRMASLVEARNAFASDILYSFFSKGGILTATSFSTDGRAVSRSSFVADVPWAEIKIMQYPGDDQYVVEVERRPSQEKWSVHQYHQPFDKGLETRQIADRYGVQYQDPDDATKIYPRIETLLRVADVSIPDAGLSLDLTSFVFVMPVVLFATLVLFGHWISELMHRSQRGVELQWVLVDARNGIVGIVARIWLVAIVVGPWLLSIVFVEAMALTLRTRGMLNTPALEGLFSVYVGAVLIMLTVATKIAAKTIIELRCLVRGASGSE